MERLENDLRRLHEEANDLASSFGQIKFARWSETEMREFERKVLAEKRWKISCYREYYENLPKLEFEILMEFLFSKIRNFFKDPDNLETMVEKYISRLDLNSNGILPENTERSLFIAKVGAYHGVNLGYCKTADEMREEIRTRSRPLY